MRFLLAALLFLVPLGGHASTSGEDRRPDTGQADTRQDRQSLRAQQNLPLSELREGERQLDSIDRKAQTDPRTARDMQRIWQADRSLAEINRTDQKK